jgi:hypothetical protein
VLLVVDFLDFCGDLARCDTFKPLPDWRIAEAGRGRAR